MKRVFLIGVLLALISPPVLAGGYFMNDTGETVYGLRVEFSEPVTITSFGDLLTLIDPPGESTTFTFSGGSVEPWGDHWIIWDPASASVIATQWLSTGDAPPLAELSPDSLPVNAFSTSFPGLDLDYCLWDIWTFNEGTAEQNERLVLGTNSSSDFSGVKAITQVWFEGDFTVEASFTLLEGWNDRIQGSGAYPRLTAGLGVYVDDARFVEVSRVRSNTASTLNTYTSLSGGELLSQVSTSGASGTLRVERQGNTLIVSANSGSGWREIARTRFVKDPVRFYLSGASLETRKQSTVAFNEFLISGAIPLRSQLQWEESYEYDPEFYVGGWVCDYFAHREWNRFWNGPSPLEVMRENGFEWVRVWVTMTSSSYLRETARDAWSSLPWRDEYWSSIEYASAIMREAQDLGMRLNAVLTLSPTAAHAGQQIPPDDWQDLSVDETCQRLEQYAFDTATHFLEVGLNVEVYDIGNEVDWGILGFRPGERLERPAGIDQVRNMSYMEQSIWPTEAQLLQAAIRGVRRANPNAQVAVHVAGALEFNTDVAGSFFEFMNAAGVDFDIAGISLPYPESGWVLDEYSRNCWYSRIQDLVDRIAQTGRKVFISECSYPSSSRGIAAEPMPDYPFTPEGQAKWVHDVLRFARANPHIDGFFYFYPDWFPGMSQDVGTWNVQSYGLFAADGIPHPAMAEFQVNLPAD